MNAASQIEFAEIDWAGRIEHPWIARARRELPLVVFLHEGLGSLSMWKDFPARLCVAARCRGLVYSRPGYGRSTPRAAEEAWNLDFMHRQAHEVLPALLAALGVDGEREKPWLFGHSDGASIALLYAAQLVPKLAGAIVLAPHILVEDLSIASIEKARDAYRDRPAPAPGAYHDDPDSAFWGWNDIWLHPPFRHWTIEAEIGSIACPLLAVQGLDDEYGTLEQIRGIARRVPQTRAARAARLRPFTAPRPARKADSRGDGVHEPPPRRRTMTLPRHALLAAAAALRRIDRPAVHAQAHGAKLKVGLMLPDTGTFAALGNAIENGFRLYVAEQGGKLGGREIEFVKVDDESDPAKATDNVNKLIKRDNVDVLVGTVHSGVVAWHGQGGQGHRHAADRAQRRRRRRHRPDVRAEHLPQLVLELAARLRDGRSGGQEGPQEGRDHHLEVRRR